MAWISRLMVVGVLVAVGCRTTDSGGEVVAPKTAAPEGKHLLVFGGGYMPSGNQASLESNVRYLYRELRSHKVPLASSHLLFADGRDSARDLQLFDESAPEVEISKLLAAIMGTHRDLAFQYRSAELPADGPCVKTSIDAYFDERAGSLGGSDELLIYYTGHGGRGNRKTQNTDLRLWDREVLDVKAFCERLDKVPESVPVRLVMVQCYGGGFANVIFEEGDPKKGLSKKPRCGFFSTIYSRVAAGCTPAIIEADYEEYSTHFWAALFGESRIGETVAKPDYNGDGMIGFNEAHAYTQLNANTIDFCVKTSDTLLRHYSRYAPLSDKEKKAREKKKEALLPEGLMFVEDAGNDAVLALADPAERAVITGLAETLGLGEGALYKEVTRLVKELEAEGKKQNDEKKKLGGEFGKLRKTFGTLILKRWPELGHRFHPDAGSILKRESKQILAAVEAHPQFEELEELGASLEALTETSKERDHKWVKCKRLQRQIEHVVARENLEKMTTPEVVARYAELRELEGRSL